MATSIFGGDADTASRVPADLRPILLDRWTALRHELDSSRPNVSAAATTEKAEVDLSKSCIISLSPLSKSQNTFCLFSVAKTRELEAEVERLKTALASKNEDHETVARQLEDMHSSYSSARQKNVSLEESHDK